MSGFASRGRWLLACIPAVLPFPAEADAPGLLVPFAPVETSRWNGTLDLRELPARSAPDRLEATIAVPEATQGSVEATIKLNGFVIGQQGVDRGRANAVRVRIERRFLSTVNRVEIGVQRRGDGCVSERCPVVGARLGHSIRLTLTKDSARPQSFADYVTRFRTGVSLEPERPGDIGLARVAKAAVAQDAPEGGAAPARIVVGLTPPDGAKPALRFDRGPVRLATREGQTVLSAGNLAKLTFAQVMSVGGKPVLWVRPGTSPLPKTMDLDYGDVAAFDGARRVIAFSPAFDTAVRIEYAADLAARPIIAPWRIVIIALWLALTAGFVFVIRRIPPLRAKAAQ